MNTVRVVMEAHGDGDFEVRTSDLSGLIEVLGEDLVTAFCTCFVHADRIVSLIAFFHLSRRQFRKGSIAERRNFLTFAAFVIGTLKEAAENLVDLKMALRSRGLFDLDAWKKELGKWEKWGTTGSIATARKKLAFHVDRDFVARGLRDIATTSGRRALLRSSTGKLRDSAFVLAQDASMRGLETALGNLDILGDTRKYLEFSDALEREFLRVLDRSDLKPIPMRSRGRRVASGA